MIQRGNIKAKWQRAAPWDGAALCFDSGYNGSGEEENLYKDTNCALIPIKTMGYYSFLGFYTKQPHPVMDAAVHLVSIQF
ncbi:hypothetical protein DRW41_06620 [Neobacillus piezotolerans]|uniref:Uncharacterized protein n=1 Tax=Neobacillus piezotolerans TaxID=2259171 RepID=A0A3D8GSR4_9BACI|nr:hypothetical protein [Neobacillus piezotolerans]RDU37514.1 hypothetical protein DRW41_06620 [Neobacillus piezotolerans]